MNCKERQEQIVLFLYEELHESEIPQLEAHIQTCAVCNEAFEQQKSFHADLASDLGPWDVPSDLLVESRRALANELDKIEKKHTWWRMPAFSLVFTPMRMLEWTTLVAIGMAGGVYFTNSQMAPLPAASSLSSPGSESVSNLRIVNSDPATGEVEMAGEMVRPMEYKGKLQDDMAQQLLVAALRDSRNPSSRLNAVEMLSAKSDSRQVKEALMRAVIEDDNAGVRLKALQSLTQFAGEDDVRAVFMSALANDEIAGIRVQAIDALTRYSKDGTTARTIQEVTKNDDNPYVQLKGLMLVGDGR